VEFHRYPVGSRTVVLGNGSEEDVPGVGTYQLRLHGGKKLLLHDALYAPGVRCSLVFFVSLIRISFSFSFHTDGLDLFYNGDLFGHTTYVSYFDSNSESVKWHARLGHVGQDRMGMLAKEGLLDRLTRVKLPRCEPCLVGKTTIKPFGKAMRASSPLELIHSDIYRPMNVKACHGAIYFITLTDDYLRYGYVYLLSHHYEALDVFKCFVAEVETQLERRIKILRTDRGREYLLDMFKEFYEEKEIQRQLTIPRTPQQNGVVERRNRTLLDMVKSMMAHANLPISFWG